jgi:hypothetical protein
MQIEYLTTRHRRDVSDEVGALLVDRRIARRVYETREIQAEPVKVEEAPEISERTGKPKRKYKRRDMAAED